MPHVLILGGGFAGLAAAKALRPSVAARLCTASLLDRENCTTMIPALPDYAAGLIPEEWITAPIDSQLPSNIRFVRTEIQSFDPRKKQVRTARGMMAYDYVVLATGSAALPLPSGFRSETAYTLAALRDARRLRSALDEHLSGCPNPALVISGSGYTGVELAVSLARRARREACKLEVLIVERSDDIMPFLNPRQRQRVRKSLSGHGIVLKTACTIEQADKYGVRLSDGTCLPHARVCFTHGTGASLVLADAGAGVREDGRLQACPDLSLDPQKTAFAAGDAVALIREGMVLRKAVNFSIYSGRCAGRNIARRLRGKPARPFHPLDLGWVIPLGNDSVGKAFGMIPLDGMPGLWLHYVMCGYRNYNLRNFARFAGLAVRAKTTKTGKDKQ